MSVQFQNAVTWRRDWVYSGRVNRTRTKDIKITEIKIFVQKGGKNLIIRQLSEEEVGVHENNAFSLGVQEETGPPY